MASPLDNLTEAEREHVRRLVPGIDSRDPKQDRDAAIEKYDRERWNRWFDASWYGEPAWGEDSGQGAAQRQRRLSYRSE